MASTTDNEKLDGSRMAVPPRSRVLEGGVAALQDPASSVNPMGEGATALNTDSPCTAGGEKTGVNATAKNSERSEDAGSISYMDLTGRDEYVLAPDVTDSVDLTVDPDSPGKVPSITPVRVMRSARKRVRVIESDDGDSGTGRSETSAGSLRKAETRGRKKKNETINKDAIIAGLQREVQTLRKRIGLIEMDNENEPPNFALLEKRSRTLPTIEQVREELRNEPYEALEGIIADSLNKIDNTADCSNNMHGGNVHKIRYGARRIQAGVLQLTQMLRIKDYEVSMMDNKDELQSEVIKLRLENKELKKEINEIKKQMEEIKETSLKKQKVKDTTENKRQKRLTIEIAELNKEKNIIIKELNRLREVRISDMEKDEEDNKEKSLFTKRRLEFDDPVRPSTSWAHRIRHIVDSSEEGTEDLYVKKNKKSVNIASKKNNKKRQDRSRSVSLERESELEIDRVITSTANKGKSGSRLISKNRNRGENKNIRRNYNNKNTRNRDSSRFRIEAITVSRGDKSSYADILRTIKTKIDINKIGIEDTRIRRTATGNLMIQLKGENCKEKADKLASEMQKVIGENAKVGRPSRKVELRIVGLDEDTGSDEVCETICNEIECARNEIKIGTIRRSKIGTGSVWLQCPWQKARRLIQEGRIKIGWVRARIYVLESGPVQCFKCWQYGHLRVHCRDSVDRTGKCYRCGGGGHVAAKCDGKLCCIICKERKYNYEHRIGSRECSARRDAEYDREKRYKNNNVR